MSEEAALSAASSMAEGVSGGDAAADLSAQGADQGEQGTTQTDASPEEAAAQAFDEGMSKLLNPEAAADELGTTDQAGSASGEVPATTTTGTAKAVAVFDDKATNLLKRAGLDAEVVKQLPEAARTAMLGQLDKMFRGIGHTLAEKGRAARAAAQATQQQQGNVTQPPTTQVQQQAQPQGFRLNLDPALLGDEATRAINEAVAPMFQQLTAVTQKLRESEQRTAVQEREALRRNVDELFTSMADNHAAYGKGTVKGLKAEQVEARKATLKLADDIWYGARSEGREMDVVDAIQMAHDALTAGQQVKNVQQRIAKTIGARRNSFTSRPSQRQTVDTKMSAEEKATKTWNEGARAIGLRG